MRGGKSRDRYATASELAEYVYCPRAWHYRLHPPPEGRSPRADAAAAAGEEFHTRTLAQERSRDRHAMRNVAIALVGVALLLVGVVTWFL